MLKPAINKKGLRHKMKKTNDSGIGEIRFENLLFQLKISSYRKEKLIVRINYTTPKIRPETETVVLSRFGMVQLVITNILEFLFSQKIRAIFTRKDFQPRDLYNIVWFLSHKIKPSSLLFSELKVKNEKKLFIKFKNFCLKKVKPNLKNFM